MSKQVDIITGARLMTEGNALRHYARLLKHTLNNCDYTATKAVIHEASRVLDTGTCYKCPHEDIGYCGLRKSDLDTQYKTMKYCAPSILAMWTREIKRLDNKRYREKKHNKLN